MSGKKHSTTAKTPDTKNGNVLVEGEREVLALRQLGIDQVFVSHADADYILPENLHRVLGANSLTILGRARGARVVRIDDQQVLLVPHHGPKAAPLEWSDCTPPARAEFLGALFIRPELREHVLGCRAEHFTRNFARFGRSQAVLLYWWDIAASLRAPLCTLIKRGLGLAALGSVCRRILGGS